MGSLREGSQAKQDGDKGESIDRAASQAGRETRPVVYQRKAEELGHYINSINPATSIVEPARRWQDRIGHGMAWHRIAWRRESRKKTKPKQNKEPTDSPPVLSVTFTVSMTPFLSCTSARRSPPMKTRFRNESRGVTDKCIGGDE